MDMNTPFHTSIDNILNVKFKSYREYNPSEGIALSVFDSKYSRKKENGKMQSWPERLQEVVYGNFMLDPRN